MKTTKHNAGFSICFIVFSFIVISLFIVTIAGCEISDMTINRKDKLDAQVTKG